MNLQLYELPRVPMEKILNFLPIKTILILVEACQQVSYLAEVAQRLAKRRELYYQRSLPSMRKRAVESFKECKLSKEIFHWNPKVESFHDLIQSYDKEVKIANSYGIKLQECDDYEKEWNRKATPLLENYLWIFVESEMTSARRTLLSPNLTKGLIIELVLISNCCGKEDEPSSLILNIRAAKGNEWKDNWRS